MSYRREITTLGRGGSDTTAVALAAALGAERCEIYSDVDGVYSADPRVVPEAHQLARVSYEEMLDLAATGGRILSLRSVRHFTAQLPRAHARPVQLHLGQRDVGGRRTRWSRPSSRASPTTSPRRR